MMLGHYPTDIIISLSIFATSLWMLLIYRTNIIMMVFSLELLLLANILGFTITSIYLNDIVGEIFSIFILAMAAIETAIALCIILSYYRITNKHINPIHIPAELVSAIVLTLGGEQYTLITLHGLVIFITILFGIYIWIWAPLAHGVSTVVWLYYNMEDYPNRALDQLEYEIEDYILQRYWIWIDINIPFKFKTTTRAYKKARSYSKKLDEWAAYGDKLAINEAKFWGSVWSIFNGEMMPRRYNRLCEEYFNKYSFPPDWNYIGWAAFRHEGVPESWYSRFVAAHTIAGQRFLEKRQDYLKYLDLYKEYSNIDAKYNEKYEQFKKEQELQIVYNRVRGIKST